MTTQDLEAAVRTAATNLLDAISAAKAGGLDVRWPSFPGGLSVIAISETAKVAKPASPAAIATPFASAVAQPGAPVAQTITPLAATASPVAEALAAKAAEPAATAAPAAAQP